MWEKHIMARHKGKLGIKKHTHTYWHNRLDKMFGDMLREAVFNCARCIKYRESLQVSHIYPKGTYQCLRYDPINVLMMDGQCHFWYWHENPLDSRDWFKVKYPGRYAYLQEAKKISFIRNEEYYQKVERLIEARDVKGLMILNWGKEIIDRQERPAVE